MKATHLFSGSLGVEIIALKSSFSLHGLEVVLSDDKLCPTL